MPEEYIFERISNLRLKDIKLLYRECFGEDVTMDFVEKKYNTESFGAGNIGYIAYDTAGTPAAYYGVFPCKAVVGGNVYLCAQSGDTMTHPRHRGKGLFIKLAKITYKLAKENGIRFVFGFPNDNSLHGFVKKLDWICPENFNVYKINVFTFPLAYLCTRISLLRRLYRNYADFIIKSRHSRRDFFENPQIDKINGGILRDKDFFEYKNYVKKDLIEIDGKCVYIKIANSLRIGDIESVDEENFYNILQKLKKLARSLGCYRLIFYYSPGVRYDKYLSAKYSPQKGSPIGGVDLGSGLDLSSLKFSLADLDTY